jgi:hypothetical protein
MPDTATIHVHGLRDLQRAFGVASRVLERDLRVGLIGAAEPVRYEATRLAGQKIRNILSATATVDWSEMRIGVTQSVVYIAPVQRGTKTRGHGGRHRPNLADLLLGRAMEPALEQNVGEVTRRLDAVLDRVGHAWEAA